MELAKISHLFISQIIQKDILNQTVAEAYFSTRNYLLFNTNGVVFYFIIPFFHWNIACRKVWSLFF